MIIAILTAITVLAGFITGRNKEESDELSDHATDTEQTVPRDREQ